MPQKSPLWRITRPPATAGRRAIRQRGDFRAFWCIFRAPKGILGRFGALLGPQTAPILNGPPGIWPVCQMTSPPLLPTHTYFDTINLKGTLASFDKSLSLGHHNTPPELVKPRSAYSQAEPSLQTRVLHKSTLYFIFMFIKETEVLLFLFALLYKRLDIIT